MRDVYEPEQPEGWMNDTVTPPRWKWHEPVRYSFPRGDALILRASGMTAQAFRLLHGLMAAAGWDNQVTDSLAIVARASGVGTRSVPRALRCLENAQLVAVDRSNPTLLHITVSPFLIWQGRPHLVYKARRAFEERRRLSPHQRQTVQQHDEDNAALAAVASLPSPD